MSSSGTEVPTSIYVFADTLSFPFPLASCFRSLCGGMYHFFSLEYLGLSWYLESIYFSKSRQYEDLFEITPKWSNHSLYKASVHLLKQITIDRNSLFTCLIPLFPSFNKSLIPLLGMRLTAMSPGYFLSWATKCDVKSCHSSVFKGTNGILSKLLNYLKCLGLDSLVYKWR